MAFEKRAAQWQVVGRSVRGASHERSGLPNQDAIRWLPQSGAGSRLVLALADGHGSARYFRSEVGARLAVRIAAEVVSDFLAGQSGGLNLSAIKRTAEEWLPGALVRRWLEAVTEHFSANGLSEVEHELLKAGSGRAVSGTVASSGLALAYGATVVVAAVTESFTIFLQLGDGEILTVSDQGEVSRPLPVDERLFANETTSLCAPEAWRDFRVSFQAISHTPPAIILLSTDGYPNSFRDESGFLKVGSDILEMIRAEGGLASVEENIETWLRDSTRAGSGDDVTLGIICRADAVEVPRSTVAGAHTRNGEGDASQNASMRNRETAALVEDEEAMNESDS